MGTTQARQRLRPPERCHAGAAVPSSRALVILSAGYLIWFRAALAGTTGSCRCVSRCSASCATRSASSPSGSAPRARRWACSIACLCLAMAVVILAAAYGIGPGGDRWAATRLDHSDADRAGARRVRLGGWV